MTFLVFFLLFEYIEYVFCKVNEHDRWVSAKIESAIFQIQHENFPPLEKSPNLEINFRLQRQTVAYRLWIVSNYFLVAIRLKLKLKVFPDLRWFFLFVLLQKA